LLVFLVCLFVDVGVRHLELAVFYERPDT
jgi:hypothetical protein